MKTLSKILLILISLSACTSKTSKEKGHDVLISEQLIIEGEDSIETIIGKISRKDLKDKSSAFLRYSRNLYFAKKGLVFNDSDLIIFFNNQDWYKSKPNVPIELDSSEASNVALLKSMEDSIDSLEYRKILYKFLFNQAPLFYLGWQPKITNYESEEYLEAGFAILDSSMLWTLECHTIPPEYIEFKSTIFEDMYDDWHYLRKDQIEIKNIDKECKGGQDEEIIVHLDGTSDDENDLVLGFNAQGKFSVLFDEFVTIDDFIKLNDSTLEFHTTIRCDFIGTMFCDKRYYYNTVSKKTTDLPYDFDKVETTTTNREKIALYTSPKTAVKMLNDSIIGYLNPKTNVEVTKFLNKKDCYLVKSKSLTGWINDEQLQKFDVCFAD